MLPISDEPEIGCRRILSARGEQNMVAPEVRRLRLWQNRIETEVEVAGSGPPLVYLHGPWGLGPDRAFVARLAGCNTVYAPKHPGTSRGDPEAVPALDLLHEPMPYTNENITQAEPAATVRIHLLLG